jgi:hypothetical protein
MGVTRVISQCPSVWLMLRAHNTAAWIVSFDLRPCAAASPFHNGFNLVLPLSNICPPSRSCSTRILFA